MKLYDKKELTFRKGMLVTKDGDALRIATAITAQANALETEMQKQMFLKDQPEATPAPTLDGFERKSIAKKKVRVQCATPLLDEKIKKAEAFMEELDTVDNAKKVEAMANEFIDRPGLHAIAVEHRVGTLVVGDLAMVAAVSASHRAEAFSACSDLVDAIKARLPIWKHQQFADGTAEWSNCP